MTEAKRWKLLNILININLSFFVLHITVHAQRHYLSTIDAFWLFSSAAYQSATVPIVHSKTKNLGVIAFISMMFWNHLLGQDQKIINAYAHTCQTIWLMDGHPNVTTMPFVDNRILAPSFIWIFLKLEKKQSCRFFPIWEVSAKHFIF